MQRKHKKARVFMIGPRLSVRGGISTIERIYFQQWDRSRFELVHVGTYGDQSASISKKALIFSAALLRVITLLTFRPPDVIHAHFSWRGSFRRKAMVVALARLFGIRRILMHCNASRFREFWEESSPRRRAWIRKVLSRANTLIVVSRSWERYFEENGIAKRIRVLYNPVACPESVPEPGTRKKAVLFLGELGARKGTYDVLTAAKRLFADHPDTELWFAGNGDLDGVERRVEEERWENRVRVLGWVVGEEKDRLLREASVFLLPSYNEGLPLAMLEAMAHGMPVVVSDVGGIPEAVQDGEDGFLIKAGDVDAIVDRVGRLLGDPDLAHGMGLNARERVSRQFEVRHILEELYSIYDELLDEQSEENAV